MTRPPRKPGSRPRTPREKAADSPPATTAQRETEFEPGLRELRSSIGNLRAAAEALAFAAVPRPALSARASRPAALLQAVIEESERASLALDRLAATLNESGAARSAAAGGRVIAVARLADELTRHAAAELGLAVRLAEPIDGSLTIAPSFARSILGALGRLRRDYSISEVELSARRHADLLALEIAFAAREPEASRLREEHHRVLAGGLRGEPALGDEARGAGGEAWLAIRRGEPRFSLRLLLPLPAAA